MRTRPILLAMVLLSTSLLAGSVVASTSSDQRVSIEQDGNSAVIKVASCDDGILCWVTSRISSFSLYVNGEETEELGYGEQYTLENSSYEDGTAEVAIAKDAPLGDDGWAYEVKKRSSGNQTTDEAGRGTERGEGGASSENRTDRYGPPELIVEELNRFGNCMDGFNREPLLDRGTSEAEYCYQEQFA